MDKLVEIKQKVERKSNRSILTFLVFLAISTGAWFLVKLSENYTTQTVFRLQFAEVPADQWIPSKDHLVKMSLNIDGFHTLRYKMIREPKRMVTIGGFHGKVVEVKESTVVISIAPNTEVEVEKTALVQNGAKVGQA